MSPLIPTRGARDYKGNKIWTELVWSSGDIPKYLLHNKFISTMDSISNSNEWYAYIPDESEDPSLVDNWYGACYGTLSVDSHISLIKEISLIHSRDRFAFSYIAVFDARTSVIGDDFDPHQDIPFLVNDEVLSGKRMHRNPEDGPHDENYIQKMKDSPVGQVTVDTQVVKASPYSVYKCHDDTLTPNSVLLYFKKPEQSIVNNWPYKDLMEIVHRDHIAWLLSVKTLSRECLTVMNKTYSRDPLLSPRTKSRMLKVAERKYALGERELYHVGRPDFQWNNLSFDDKMKQTYDEHITWLSKRESIDHIQHRRWRKIYKYDQIMDTMDSPVRDRVNGLINHKFGVYIINIPSDISPRIRRAAFSYWANEIPVAEPYLPPLVPFDLW